MDEPQLIQVPIENSMDMGFSMPTYTKWLTSQLQLVKDRFILDIDTEEKVWQRIYPQENGVPVCSPTGKYWVKLRFMGKERLVEIDDRVPCDVRSMPIFARTQNIREIWPQLLMKALCKVYSHKWYTQTSQYDKEIGDGAIIYSLTGLIPEHVSITNFEAQALPLFRQLLSDEQYFGHKSYLTCYCKEEFRPKLPSQLTQISPMTLNQNDTTETNTEVSFSSSSGGFLSKLKAAANMAISVTTGRKLRVNKNANASNVIPGFGYAICDLFENQYVDMDSIVKTKDTIEEEKSPYASPAKRGLQSPSPNRLRKDPSITKEEARAAYKAQKKAEQEEEERREREPPKQHSLLHIKTAVTRYPTINYVSPFSQEEIIEGKRCLLNHWKRTPEAQAARDLLKEAMSAKRRRGNKGFSLTLADTMTPMKTKRPESQMDAASV